MFLHGSWDHILGNMLFLAVFGKNVEDAFGPLRYLVFYFAGGFVATITQTLATLAFGTAAEARVPNLGASGAIAAVLGAYFVLYPNSNVFGLIVIFPVRISAYFFLGAWFLYQLIEANFGLFFGALVAWLLTGAGAVAPQDRSAALRAPPSAASPSSRSRSRRDRERRRQARQRSRA
jgi:rhomboid family protein